MADPRIDPRLASLVRAQLSRRSVLRGAGAVGAASLLAACGTSGTDTEKSADERAAADRSDQDKSLKVSTWVEYIDVDDKNENKRPTVDAFEKKTGVSVKYVEDINENNSFFAKVRHQLSAGQDPGRDIMILTDWLIGRLIRLGWVQKLDKANIPNATNVIRALAKPGFDPDRDYSLPWQSGMTGIGYNRKALGRDISSIDDLFDPKLKGRVTMLTEMRDTMGLLMLSMGKDPAKFVEDDFKAAVAKLQEQVDKGQIRKFTGNEYTQGLAKGDIAACLAWSGDVIQLQFDDPNIKFVAPDSGLMLWSDNMVVPNKAPHKKNAEEWMNYYYDPKVAAKVAAWVNYICPVEGAKEEMAKIDKSLVDNQLIFPTDSFLTKTHIFQDLSAEEERSYEGMFQDAIGA